MSDKTPKAARFIEVLVQRTFEQLIRGQYDFEKDLTHLQRYLNQAKALNAPLLEARILNNLAILHNVSGRGDACEAFLWEAYQIYDDLNQSEHMTATLGNLAKLQMTRGDYETALSLLERALALEHHNNLHFLLAGKMSALLALQRLEEIFRVFRYP